MITYRFGAQQHPENFRRVGNDFLVTKILQEPQNIARSFCRFTDLVDASLAPDAARQATDHILQIDWQLSAQSFFWQRQQQDETFDYVSVQSFFKVQVVDQQGLEDR